MRYATARLGDRTRSDRQDHALPRAGGRTPIRRVLTTKPDPAATRPADLVQRRFRVDPGRFIHLDTGEILSEYTIDPTRGYWRNQLTPPGRWPQKRQTSRDI